VNGIPSLQIQTTPGRMQLPKLKGELAIDQYSSRASYNMKTVMDNTRDDAQRGYQTAMATIGRIAADGDAVANRQATVAALAVSAAEPLPVTVDFVSIARPDIRYDINRQPGDYQPAQVQISVDIKA
jgi:hypothetical protein